MSNTNKPEWLIHYVINDKMSNSYPYINAHTHGMEKFNHLDFQIVIYLDPDLTGYLLNTLGERVKNGETFKNGDIIEGLVANGYSLKLKEFEEMDRKVLRVIIPDENYLFPDDAECHPYYKNQYKTTNELFQNLS